ncbi:MAG: hypothetical protein K8R73_00285, partial [Clostridiales bacterium]|nr:hypothetical protein [Clostridiales bacterium]
MKKSFVIVLSIFLVLITATATFFVTSFIQINVGDKLVISQEDMDDYRAFYEQYGEVEDLKEYILENYYLDIEDEVLIEGMKKGLFEILDDP